MEKETSNILDILIKAMDDIQDIVENDRDSNDPEELARMLRSNLDDILIIAQRTLELIND